MSISYLQAEAETFLLQILKWHEICKGQTCQECLRIQHNVLVIISDLAELTELLSLTVHLLLHSYRLEMVNQQAATDHKIVQKLLSKGV